jgi:hypothetical protein
MFSGYVMMAYFWAQQAAVASEKLASGDGKESAEFYKAKLKLLTSTLNVYYHAPKVMLKQWSILQKP